MDMSPMSTVFAFCPVALGLTPAQPARRVGLTHGQNQLCRKLVQHQIWSYRDSGSLIGRAGLVLAADWLGGQCTDQE